MPKFRTMKINTPHVTTSKLTNPQQWVTPFESISENIA